MGGSAEANGGAGAARVPVPPARPFLDTFRGNLKETFFPDDPFRGVVRERGAGRRTVAALRYFFPFLEWMPAYRLGTFKSDLIAGITIASLAIPQGISYAKLASLPPILGLCKLCMHALIVVLQCSIRPPLSPAGRRPRVGMHTSTARTS
jgi:sulfate transporter 3